ncbi:MAG TPA: hypothetical protein PKH39_06195 [Woeseiaceae bacterium]|nr:hypothetical protein [Woeseiaceae bacterium]
MSNKIKTWLYEWVPGIRANGVYAIVPIHRIPAIDKIVSQHTDTTVATESVFLPSVRIVVTENTNGSFAVLNDLDLILPELTRIESSQIEVTVLDAKTLDPDSDDEEAMRSFFVNVLPYRHLGNVAGIAEMSSEGLYDSLCRIYGSKRSEPGKFTAVSALFPNKQVAKSTFDRIVAELQEPSKKTLRNAANQKRKKLAKDKKKKEEKARKKKNGRQKTLF